MRFWFGIIVFIIASFQLNADYITFSKDINKIGFVPYYRVDDGYIGLSNVREENAVLFDKNRDYYLIINVDNEIKDVSLLSGENWALFDFTDEKHLRFRKGQIIKLTFDMPIVVKKGKSIYSSEEINYAFLDSISSYVSSDTMYKIVSVLSGDEAYPSGFISKTRFITQEGCDSASIYLYDRFVSYGMDTVFFQEFAGTTGTWAGGKPYITRNVVAIKRGSRTSDTCVVVGGHFDSISEPYDDDTTIAPGADDNASGTAGVHEVARIFSQLNLDNDIDIYFVDFSAEEIGLIGSYRFINDYLIPEGIYVKGMINMDMISYNDNGNEVDVHGSGNSQPIRDVFIDIGSNITSLIFIPQASTYGSDHYYFEQAGYKAVFAIEGDYYTYTGYHTPGDTIGWLDFSFARDIARTALATAYYVANSPSSVNDVYLIDNGDSSITVSWTIDSASDVVGYRVYYHTEYGDIYTLEVGDTNRVIIYPVFPDSLYYVGVSAIDTMEFEGFIEEEDTITPSFVPHPVADISDYYSDRNYIYLYWNRSICADFKDYLVLRKISGEWDTIATVIDTMFIDSTVSDTMVYWYAVVVEDSSGYRSDIVDSVPLRLITMENNIVVIDETFNSRIWSDDETDDFYSGIFNEYPVIDMDSLDEVGIDQFGNAKVVFYIDDDKLNITNKINKKHLEKYIESGGKFILCGWEVADKMMGYPSIPYYTNSSDILNTVFGITMFDRNADQDLEYVVYDINGEDTIYFNADISGFTYLPDIDVFEYDSTMLSFGYYKSVSGSEYDGDPVMLMRKDTSVIIVSVPLYSMDYYDAKQFVSDILSLYNLPLIEDSRQAEALSLAFRLNDNIIEIKANIDLEKVDLIDISGRRLNVKVNGAGTNRVMINWQHLSKGIYFLRIHADNDIYVKKFVRIY